MVFKITPLHTPHGKRVAPLLSVCLLGCCIAMVTARTTENQLRNSHSAISLALAYCCLATRNNIRNSIVACVYSVARSVA
jgi:hypothetical protein